MYWSDVEIPNIPTDMVNTVPYLQSKPMPVPAESEAIQGTGYALLVYLRHNLFTEALPIVHWLHTHRSTDAGFDGTQVVLEIHLLIPKECYLYLGIKEKAHESLIFAYLLK